MARILVVDDHLPMRRLMNIHLTEAGHSVIEASEAAHAISILLRQGFDLIVTDVHMPYLDGLNFAHAIKADPRTCHVPIVILTGDDDEALAQQSQQLGAYLLSKSSPMEEIVWRINPAITKETGMPAPRTGY